MQKQIMSREEMETIIIGNAASKEWEVCTADPKVQRMGYRKRGFGGGFPPPLSFLLFAVAFPGRLGILALPIVPVQHEPAVILNLLADGTVLFFCDLGDLIV